MTGRPKFLNHLTKYLKLQKRQNLDAKSHFLLDEHNHPKFNRQARAHHSQRQTYPQPKLEVELGNISKQQSTQGASTRMQIWILHPPTDKLGRGGKEEIPRSANIGINN